MSSGLNVKWAKCQVGHISSGPYIKWAFWQVGPLAIVPMGKEVTLQWAGKCTLCSAANRLAVVPVSGVDGSQVVALDVVVVVEPPAPLGAGVLVTATVGAQGDVEACLAFN